MKISFVGFLNIFETLYIISYEQPPRKKKASHPTLCLSWRFQVTQLCMQGAGSFTFWTQVYTTSNNLIVVIMTQKWNIAGCEIQIRKSNKEKK